MNNRSKHSTSRERGFTLIELLVSMTLMALILGVLAAGISVVARGWDKNTALISAQDMFSRGYGLLRRDVEGLQRLVWQRDEGPEFIFQGLDDSLKFVVIEPPYPTRPGPYIVSYFVKKSATENILMRARTPFHPDIQDFASVDMKDEVPLLEGPYKYRFTYGETRSGRRNWFKSWPHKNRLPDLIKLDVIDIKSGQSVFVPLIASTKIDAELGCLERRRVACTTRTRGELVVNNNNKKKP